MGFKVLVHHIEDDTTEIYEAESEPEFIGQLYSCGLDYSFEWTPHNECQAVIYVY